MSDLQLSRLDLRGRRPSLAELRAALPRGGEASRFRVIRKPEIAKNTSTPAAQGSRWLGAKAAPVRPAIDAVRETGMSIAEVALCYTSDLTDPA